MLLFFSGLAIISIWDLSALAKEKKKKEMFAYALIAVLSVVCAFLYFFTEIRFVD